MEEEAARSAIGCRWAAVSFNPKWVPGHLQRSHAMDQSRKSEMVMGQNSTGGLKVLVSVYIYRG